MSSIMISVILPVYNGEVYIQEAINSILNQTFTNWELIIVDDASNDGTSKKVLAYTDSRIIYKHNKHNLGNYPARNIGVQLARGKYIAVMDADDVAYPERLQKEYQYLEEHLDVLAIGCNCTINGLNMKYKRPVNYEDILAAFLNNNCFIHSSLLIRRDIFLKLGGYDSRFVYAADYDLICRVALLGKIENLPEVLMMYRWHEEQISQKYTNQQQMYADEIRRKYQLCFIRKYATHKILPADHYIVAHPRMGELICLYLFSTYTGHFIYKERADTLLDMIFNWVEEFDFYKHGDTLCYFCCGILYLLRNNMVEGNEEDILADIDLRLATFCSKSELCHLDEQKISGWIHYLRLRIQSDVGDENIRISNINTLTQLSFQINL